MLVVVSTVNVAGVASEMAGREVAIAGMDVSDVVLVIAPAV